jgi:hypothetical protein
MEPLEDIPFHQFISYKDFDNFIYGFDINSIYHLILKNETAKKNPYNRNDLPDSFLKNLKTIIRISKILNIPINLEQENEINELSREKKLELKALEIFQYINTLGHYSDVNWFLSLNRFQLKKFLTELEDVWFYRAGLTLETRISLCPPDGNPFPNFNIRNVFSQETYIIKSLTLALIETFIKQGFQTENRSLAAYYILGTLTTVSQDAAEALPWLFESFFHE